MRVVGSFGVRLPPSGKHRLKPPSHIPPDLRFIRFHAQGPSVGHGVRRVEEEIDENLLELGFVSPNRGEFWFQIEFRLHLFK